MNEIEVITRDMIYPIVRNLLLGKIRFPTKYGHLKVQLISDFLQDHNNKVWVDN